MTDEELERALFALPLEEPPADLHARILAATIERPRLAFRSWEIWLAGTAFAFVVWLMFLVGTSVPDLGTVISQALNAGIDRLVQTVSPSALVWMALGSSFAVWISLLTLPPSRRDIANR
jgi:hypothetical protein